MEINLRMLSEEDDFTDQFKLYIYRDIDTIFPLLNKTEKDLIKRMMISLLVLIYKRFNFEIEQTFYIQLSDNNNQDIRMILFLLFPYMNDNDNFKIHKRIQYLKDLSLNLENTNIQYDRYFGEENDYDKNKYEYNILDIYNNYLVSYDTIHKCAYHLYCNWKQVIPLTLTNYQNSYIYQHTIRNDEIPNNDQITGLDVRDYYHAIINDMFYDVLKYKWLMYEKYDVEQNKDVMFVEDILNYYSDNISIFIQNWDSFIANVNPDILYNILLHFDMVSDKYKADQKKVTKFNEDEVYERDDNNQNELFQELKDAYNKTTMIEYIYSFLFDTLNGFSRTWYGKMMFPKKIFSKKELVQLKDVLFNNQKIFDKPIYRNSFVSYKNIYNFSKSLIISGINNINIIREWDGVDINKKREILRRLNTRDNAWFNIRNNLEIKYGSSVNTMTITNNIFNQIKPNITDLVFHCLISRGLLNEFKVKRNTNEINESFNGYYFITQSKYNEMDPYRFEKNSGYRTFTNDILQNIKKNSGWINLFALNWVQQIHFYKHFFNQRVIYVTGGTGTGKSTQVPKLLWYGLFLIGQYNGKIVNTQPRTNATTNNSERVSEELGVPIMVYSDKKNKKDNSNNYYLQYSTQNKKHNTKNSENVPEQTTYLEIVTDGTLLSTVKKSPFLKITRKENKKDVDTPQNAYDIISIDEAHEHNKNMDLLLTFLRDTIKLNNSLRLVIITATIDNDEPNYRRYYKYINDNLLYPLNNILFNRDGTTRYWNRSILSNISQFLNLDTNYFNLDLDRRSIDRRIHIAPPQGSTNFRIEEHYQEKEINSYDEAEKIGIDKAIEITKYATGEILFFSVTENKINEIVTYLNSKISAKWIAIPYYSKIVSEWKEIIEKVPDTINKIKLDKKDILKAIKGDEYDMSKSNNYERVIIVSTNIAEASITINSLKYVIDTGYVNTVAFDPKLELLKQGPEKITDAARIQRRGRVGRVQSGTVYYIYKKDSRKDIPMNYNITQQVNTLVYDLIDFIKEDSKPLVLENLKKESLNKLNDNIKLQYKNDTSDFFSENNNSEFSPNIYLGNNLDNYYIYSPKYLSGYDYNSIVDYTGNFYIIHPLENMFIRDKWSGQFINMSKKINIFTKFFKHLFMLRLISIEENSNNNFIKTKIYTIYDELKDNIKEIITANDMNYNKLIAMILGARYNRLEEVLFINVILENSSIGDLSRKTTSRAGKEYPDSSLLLEKFGDVNSDLQVYLNIFKKLKLVIPQLIDMDPNEINIEYTKSINGQETNLTILDIESLKNYEKREKDKRRKIRIFKNTNNINNKRVELWCDQYGLDYSVISNILNKYFTAHRVGQFIKDWVTEYINYIPYFENQNNLEFIYISSYINLLKIDNRMDYLMALKDPNSIVNGDMICALKFDQQNSIVTIKELIRFNKNYIAAFIPRILYELEENKIPWDVKHYYYTSVTSDMLEKYLLPESTNNKEEKENIKIYNNRLLSLFRLLRTKL
jgi:hypothetical protein